MKPDMPSKKTANTGALDEARAAQSGRAKVANKPQTKPEPQSKPTTKPKPKPTTSGAASAPSAGTAQFFAFRINRLRIFKNREWGAGELKMISFVSTGDEAPSALDGLLQTSDPDAKRKILRDASRQMLSVKEFIQVDEIRDGHVLTFGDSGYALYTAMRIPVSLNWTFLILESDEDVVELGRRIDTVVDGKDFDTFATSALALLATAVTPQLTAAAAIAKFVSRAIPQVLVRNRDDQVGLYYLSLNRMEHYPNGERKRDDVPDLSNNVRVDYSIFGTTYTV
jgi:hypothetical protein